MPPLEITDLIEELQDGHVLLSLLEVLLGKTLVRPSNWLNGFVWLFASLKEISQLLHMVHSKSSRFMNVLL